jgi:hypothetical protein
MRDKNSFPDNAQARHAWLADGETELSFLSFIGIILKALPALIAFSGLVLTCYIWSANTASSGSADVAVACIEQLCILGVSATGMLLALKRAPRIIAPSLCGRLGMLKPFLRFIGDFIAISALIIASGLFFGTLLGSRSFAFSPVLATPTATPNLFMAPSYEIVYGWTGPALIDSFLPFLTTFLGIFAGWVGIRLLADFLELAIKALRQREEPLS